MPIEATVPSTVNAEFPYWAFTFTTQGLPAVPFGSDGPIPVVAAVLEFTRFRERPSDSVAELSPLPTDRASLRIDDLYTLAATEPLVADALAALMAAVAKVATDEGIL